MKIQVQISWVGQSTSFHQLTNDKCACFLKKCHYLFSSYNFVFALVPSLTIGRRLLDLAQSAFCFRISGLSHISGINVLHIPNFFWPFRTCFSWLCNHTLDCSFNLASTRKTYCETKGEASCLYLVNPILSLKAYIYKATQVDTCWTFSIWPSFLLMSNVELLHLSQNCS